MLGELTSGKSLRGIVNITKTRQKYLCDVCGLVTKRKGFSLMLTLSKKKNVRRCVCRFLWLFIHVNISVISMYIRHYHHVLYLCHVFVMAV